MKTLLSLVKKDLANEFRTFESLVTLIAISLLVTVVIAVSCNTAFISSKDLGNLFPSLIWVVFIFAASISLGRGFEPEMEHRGHERMLLFGVSPVSIYLSKVIYNFILVAIGHAISVASLSIFLNISVIDVVLPLAVISFLVMFGYVALACLFQPISSASKIKGVLLPIILIPLLFPLFFGGAELTTSLILEKSLDWSSVWVSLLIACDVVYIVLGLNLYEFVIRE